MKELTNCTQNWWNAPENTESLVKQASIVQTQTESSDVWANSQHSVILKLLSARHSVFTLGACPVFDCVKKQLTHLSPHAQARQTQFLFSSSSCWGAQSGLALIIKATFPSIAETLIPKSEPWQNTYKAALSSSIHDKSGIEQETGPAHSRAAFGTPPFLLTTHQGLTLIPWNRLPLSRQTWTMAINRGAGEGDEKHKYVSANFRNTANFGSTVLQFEKQLLPILCNIKCTNTYKSSIILLQEGGRIFAKIKNPTKHTAQFFSRFWGEHTHNLNTNLPLQSLLSCLDYRIINRTSF